MPAKIRPGTADDLAEIRTVINASPEAAHWEPEGYSFLVAEVENTLAGFLVWRRTAPDEIEVLNLAVDPKRRRQGIARTMLAQLPEGHVFLEVRESNQAARALYQAAGFEEIGARPRYYQDPPEGAIVMRLQSW